MVSMTTANNVFPFDELLGHPGTLGFTSGIGSLPHHNIDSALAFSFQFQIPFLPQIPIRNPWEFMIAQALEGLPGLRAEKDGTAILDVDIWHSGASLLTRRLNEAIEQERYEWFEPSAATSSSWHPFLWELRERAVRVAKIQIAGPLTAQWALQMTEHSGTTGNYLDRYPDISNQIYRLLLVRALAMTSRLQAQGITPILFLDEPGLYGISKGNARHLLGLRQLQLMVQTLKKKGVIVGLHCCSNTDWNSVLGLGFHFISLDTALSLENCFSNPDSIERFVNDGGRFSLGVVPTTVSSFALHGLNAKDLIGHFLAAIPPQWDNRKDLFQRILKEALYTPACGLALHTAADAELILAMLKEFQTLLPSQVGIGPTA